MKKNIMLCVMLFMTLNVCAQSKISKIFCRELQDTVAIERTEKGVKIAVQRGKLKSVKDYDTIAVITNGKYKRTEKEQADKMSFEKNGGRTQVRNILFEKYNLRYGGGITLFYSGFGVIDAMSVVMIKINWLDSTTYPDELIVSIFLDFRKSFVFPTRDNEQEYSSGSFMI